MNSTGTAIWTYMAVVGDDDEISVGNVEIYLEFKS